jgi:hypothetical protein
VGGTLPLGVPGVRDHLVLGAQPWQGGHGAHEHGVLEHQPVDGARGP